MRPVTHGEGIPIPNANYKLETSEPILNEESPYEPEEIIKSPQTCNQFELNDLIRDLNLSKDSAQLLD